MERDCHQVLWLYGADHQLTEVGTMNLFVFWVNEKGGKRNKNFECSIVIIVF